MALLARATSKNPSDWTDRELMRWVLRSDARGWAELVRRYRPLIYRCITKVTLKYAPSLGSARRESMWKSFAGALGAVLMFAGPAWAEWPACGRVSSFPRADWRQAAALSNAAAAVVVGKVGTASVTPAELQTAVGNGFPVARAR